MEMFSKKRSESFDSCCSGLDDHLNHHSPSHPHHQLSNGHGHHHHHHHPSHHHHALTLAAGAPVAGAGGTGDNKACTSTRSSSGASSCSSRRKKAPWEQNEANHSTGSLLSTMQKFVQTVDDMNETILVPCRLMDLKFDEKVSKTTPINANDPKGHLMANLDGVDLFQFYAVLNSVKNDLMWGTNSNTNNTNNSHHGHGHHHHNSHHHHNGTSSGVPSSAASTVSSTSSTNAGSVASNAPSSSTNTSASSNGEVKGHVRRPSTVSTTSSASASDTEFSELNEDSGVEGEEEYPQQMSDSFHHHLSGLQHCLRDLTLAADYITTRYNNDLGGVNL